jgi:tRNA dimethylallyltransferase
VIAGPTASGKTSLGVRLAQALGGEVISADSRQIYRYMDVGTAKPTAEERAGIPHHLLDIVDPDQTYSASDFSSAASSLIEEIVSRNRVPIVVGGSGFYLEALFEGLSPIPDVPDDVRAAVQDQVSADPESAHQELVRLDPVAASRVTSADPQRVARALEVFKTTGKTLSDFQSLPRVPGTSRPSIQFGLTWERECLYERINLRTHQMIDDGLVDEVGELLERGYHRETYALKTFGYREIGAVLSDEMQLDDAVLAIQTGTRRYAKRQFTWFRNRSNLRWLACPDVDPLEEILVDLGCAG